MDVNWLGVVVIWAGMLWPLLVAGGYLLMRGRAIARRGRFFWLAATLGYGAMLLTNILIVLFARLLVDRPEWIERLWSPMMLIGTVALYGLPLWIAHRLYLAALMPSKGGARLSA